MSAIPVAPTAPTSTKRPGVLVTAMTLAVVGALAAIVNGVVIATGGIELIKELLVQEGLPAGLSDSDVELAAQLSGYSTVDEFINTFAMRGYLSLGAGVALLLFGVLMSKAANWARIMVTLSSVAVMLFSIVILGDTTTPMMAGLAMLAVLVGILTIVFTWLPANGRYGKALKRA